MENQETPEQAHENKYGENKGSSIPPKTAEEYYQYFKETGFPFPFNYDMEVKPSLSTTDKISLIESLSFLAGQEFTDEVSGVRRGLLSVDERKKLAGVVMKLSDQVLDEVCPEVGDQTAIEFAKKFI